MFGIGSTEILVIIVVALVVLGPKSLPGIAKTLGKVMGEFRRVTTEFQRTMNAEVAQDEHEKRKKEAEEELFGDDNKKEDVASTSKVPPESTAKSTAEQSETTTPCEDVAKNTTNDEDPAQGSMEDKNTVEIDANSPLGEAVAKAEAEAKVEAEAKS